MQDYIIMTYSGSIFQIRTSSDIIELFKNTTSDHLTVTTNAPNNMLIHNTIAVNDVVCIKKVGSIVTDIKNTGLNIVCISSPFYMEPVNIIVNNDENIGIMLKDKLVDVIDLADNSRLAFVSKYISNVRFMSSLSAAEYRSLAKKQMNKEGGKNAVI